VLVEVVYLQWRVWHSISMTIDIRRRTLRCTDAALWSQEQVEKFGFTPPGAEKSTKL